MDDDFEDFVDGRPAAPPYRPQARAQARERLLREARRGFRFPRLGWQAAAAFGVTVTLVGGVAVALAGQGAGPDRTSTATSVNRTATQYFPELQPKPGQFILIESDTMYGATVGRPGAEPTRHLYRTHRKIYQSVDGQADGLLLIEGLEPKPWPGEKLPENAHRMQPPTRSWLASCPGQRGDQRDDYSYLSTLPADPERMRERFYQDDPGDRHADEVAFDAAGELVRETYLPKAQREAVFKAIKAIPGVEEAQGVQDSAGRTGVALGRQMDGTLHQLVFDPETHTLLGERGTVVDAKVAGAPEGSLIAHTAELSVTVVDKLPQVDDVDGDGSCAPQPVPAEPTPSPTVTVTSKPRDGRVADPSESKRRVSPDDLPSDGPAPRTGPAESPVAKSTKAPAARPAESPAG
jgi:hypothetical protein